MKNITNFRKKFCEFPPRFLISKHKKLVDEIIKSQFGVSFLD